MPAPAGDTANLNAVRPVQSGNCMISSLALKYIAVVLRALGATTLQVPTRTGLNLHTGSYMTSLATACTTLGSTAPFQRVMPGKQLVPGQMFNQILAATKALNV